MNADNTAAIPRVSAGGAVLIGLWFGLAGGLIEAARHATWRYGFGQFTRLPDSALWLGPLSLSALLVVLTGALAAAAWKRQRRPSLALVVFVAAAVAALNVLMLLGALHFVAQLLLAVGIAMQAAHWAQKAHDRFLTACRRTVPALVAAEVCVMLAASVGPALRERQALASTPAAAAGAPNVLLIVLDTVRADAVCLAGDGACHTLNLCRLAASSVVFENAIAPAPWTLPSHAAMFTGRYPHELSTDWDTPLDSQHATLAEWFTRYGYRTGGFIGNITFCSQETGLARGFLHYDDFPLSAMRVLTSTALGRGAAGWYAARYANRICRGTDRRDAANVSAAFLRWLDRPAHRQRPFFAFLNYFDAHDPYLAPPPFATRVAQTERELDVVCNWWHTDKPSLLENEVALNYQSYRDCVAWLDAEVGRLADELARRGLWDDTIVIVTADHGEHFGDHDLYGHGNSLYQPSVHVPFLVRFPGRLPGGRRVPSAVSLRDLPATLTQLVGSGAAEEFPGRSLACWWDATGTVPTLPDVPVLAHVGGPSPIPACGGTSPVFAGTMHALMLGQWKLIRNGDGTEELYDLASDPGELYDLAATESNRRAHMGQLMDEALAKSGEAAPDD